MSVYKRSDSRFYWYDFYFRGERYRDSTGLTNKIAAQRVESTIKEKLALGRAGLALPKDPAPFFYLHAAKMLESEQTHLRPNTVRNYFVALGNLERFHKKRLDEITAAEIQQFIADRLEAGSAAATVNRDLAFLRRVLQLAVSQDLVETTPFLARKVKLLKERKCQRVLSFSEERRYIGSANQPLADIATLMLELALRPSECFAIRVGDVHLRSNHLHVAGTKTEDSDRDVPITARARAVLERRLAECKGEHLFPLRTGNGFDWSEPMTSVKDQHREALKASGVRSFRVYDLRHTGATRAAEGGASPLDLQKLLGHTNLSTTARYIHLSKAHLAGVQQKIERYRAEQEIAEAEAQNGEATVQ